MKEKQGMDESRRRTTGPAAATLSGSTHTSLSFTDNRSTTANLKRVAEGINNSPQSIAQRQVQEQMNANPTVAPLPVQRASEEEDELLQGQFAAAPPTNKTGMPDDLKSGIESLSGMDMSDVRVHRNSDKPAQLNALAYAQGNEIHLGAGQEQHLPHEAWHVVQQRQGRVKPTLQMAGVEVNDDVSLEKEADVMGERASQMKVGGQMAGPDDVTCPMGNPKRHEYESNNAGVNKPVQMYTEYLMSIARYLGVEPKINAIADSLGISPRLLWAGLLTLTALGGVWTSVKLISYLTGGQEQKYQIDFSGEKKDASRVGQFYYVDSTKAQIYEKNLMINPSNKRNRELVFRDEEFADLFNRYLSSSLVLYRGVGRWHETWGSIMDDGVIPSLGEGMTGDFDTRETSFIPFSSSLEIAVKFARSTINTHASDTLKKGVKKNISEVEGYSTGDDFDVGVVLKISVNSNDAVCFINLGETQVKGPINDFEIERRLKMGTTLRKTFEGTSYGVVDDEAGKKLSEFLPEF